MRLGDPDHVVAVREPRDLLGPRHRDGAHLGTRVRDDVPDVVAVVDPRLHDQRPLSGDLRTAQPTDELFALAAEYRAADNFEPSAPLGEQPDHPRETIGGAGRTQIPSARGSEG